MAETSKNKIYYNDNENNAADVLADMKKLAQSTDDAIEKSKYNDTQIKKDISNMKTEITAKDNAQDNKILKLQTEKAELEKELKEAQEDFYQNSIRGQASGEYIHVEDSSGARCKIGISGNSEQETRSGKNFLELMEGTYLNNGITAVVKNGIVTLNGTATAISFVGINLLKSLELTNNKTYHLSAFNEKTAGDGTNYCSLRINQDNIQVLFNKTNANGSITTNLKISYITIRTQSGITYNNFVVKPQLEIGNGTDTWEQGGASPSPDYLSQVKAVGSNVNLFDKDNMTIGKIWNGATLLDSDVGNASPKIPVTAGKTYIRNAGYSSNYIIKENNSVVDVQGGTNAITMPEDAKYWMFNIPKDIDINTIKAEEGSISTPQSKYGQGCVKVTKCNKNILNIEDIDETEKNGIKYSVKNGILKLNGTATASFDIQLSKNIKIKKGKYTHSSSYIQPGLYISFNNLGYTIISAQVGKKRTFEITEDTTYKSYFIWIDKGTVLNNVEIKLQLEAGTTVTDFIEHQSQSVIMPVQKEMLEGDYVADVEHHEWKKLTLTGNENIKLNTAFANVFNIEIPKINIMNQQVCLCNIAKGVVYNTALFTIQDNIIMTASLNKIVYKSTKFSSLSEFKTYLQNQYEEGTPVIVYYKLAEPINLELTDEQKAVAKDLNNARTYKNVTNITTDSKAILSLDYTKDLETLLTSKESEV